jgi:hypothetical protein
MVSVSKGFQSDDRAERVKRTLGIAASVKGQVGMDQQRDPHSSPVPDEAWMADATTRKLGRVEVFNATRPGGMDGWTMDVLQITQQAVQLLARLES